MNDFKWPKDGLVLVLCEGGKYWAATVDPQVLKEAQDAPFLGEKYFQPALHHLKELAKQSRKDSLEKLCKQHINRKLAVM